MTATLYWFRRDLRLADNPALLAAIENSESLLPVYIHAPNETSPWQAGAASHWWLHHSLQELQNQLHRRGSHLAIETTEDTARCLLRLCKTHGLQRVVWTRQTEPLARQTEEQVATMLSAAGIETLNCPANLFAEPGSLMNGQGAPYRVFSAFWKRLQVDLPHLSTPVAAPLHLPKLPAREIETEIDSLNLLPRLNWADGFSDRWQPGEQGAHLALDDFLPIVGAYASQRDVPAQQGTSRLSPHLHFGELSMRQVVHGLRFSAPDSLDSEGGLCYLKELAWREFAAHLLHHFPHTVDAPLDEKFAAFPWRRAKRDLTAWQQGQTGIPIVDAGMRELWATGWMHNRVRMIAASFLTKHLLIDWREGARWFWETLVDADLANNTMGWQWVAGSGADAAPYFRVFNPVLQGKKFDPQGHYVRRWVPEIASLPDSVIHAPWEKPKASEEAGIQLGRDYPKPLCDLKEGRQAALAAYARIKTP